MKKEKEMDRRRFLQLAGSTAVLSVGFTRFGSHLVRAQENSDLAGLGLPELKVTLTDAGYEVSPAEIPAGWTLVSLENQQSAGDYSADIMKIPPEEDIEDVLDVIATTDGPPPAWVYQTTFAGAPWALAGKSAQVVALLTAGDWLIFGGGTPLTPAPLRVTEGEATPAAQPALTADLEVNLKDFTFEGLEQAVPAGPQLWKVTNTGPQPHFMTLSPLPPGTTQPQFMEMLAAMMSGTPAPDAGGPPPPNAGGSGTISNGQSLFVPLDLAAGTYGALCFFPDEHSGAPHVAMGMAQVFTVE
jgi:hypothetical protein